MPFVPRCLRDNFHSSHVHAPWYTMMHSLYKVDGYIRPVLASAFPDVFAQISTAFIYTFDSSLFFISRPLSSGNGTRDGETY